MLACWFSYTIARSCSCFREYYYFDHWDRKEDIGRPAQTYHQVNVLGSSYEVALLAITKDFVKW